MNKEDILTIMRFTVSLWSFCCAIHAAISRLAQTIAGMQNKPQAISRGQIKTEDDNQQEELVREGVKTEAGNLKREQSPATDHAEEDGEEADSPNRGGEVDSDGNEIVYPKWRRHLLPNYDSDGNEMPGQWGYYYDSDHSDNEQDRD